MNCGSRTRTWKRRSLSLGHVWARGSDAPGNMPPGAWAAPGSWQEVGPCRSEWTSGPAHRRARYAGPKACAQLSELTDPFAAWAWTLPVGPLVDSCVEELRAANESLAVRLWPPWLELVKLLTSLWAPGVVPASVVSWREIAKRRVGPVPRPRCTVAQAVNCTETPVPALGSERTQPYCVCVCVGGGSEENTVVGL